MAGLIAAGRSPLPLAGEEVHLRRCSDQASSHHARAKTPWLYGAERGDFIAVRLSS